ncbi:4'-phosphopantetheinyl transferase superfamily protein [Planctomycetota bacterium]|nr:4'-phosphopantetheinyl transferase superfamily protein [Planctomycetota bacterium]
MPAPPQDPHTNRAHAPGPRPLSDQRIEVWTLRPEDVDPATARRDHAHLMSPHERARYERFRGDRLRHDFLMARALVRRTLSRYADVAPEDWTFELGSHGKPSIARRHGSRVRFNLSHTRGMIACAVRLDEEVGLDVETSARRNDITRIADRFFSAEEVRALRTLPAAEHPARFFTYWALKEAYIKARGLGLAIPLGAFTFRVDGGGPIGIELDERITEDPGGWRFDHRWATDVHSLAPGDGRAGSLRPPAAFGAPGQLIGPRTLRAPHHWIRMPGPELAPSEMDQARPVGRYAVWARDPHDPRPHRTHRTHHG